MLKTEPKGFSARVAVGLSTKKATKGGNHAHSLSEGRRLFRRDWVLSLITDKGLPVSFFEKNSTRYVRRFSAQLCEVKNSPGYNHINGQTGLDGFGLTKLSFFDFTPIFKGFMINLNAPAAAIPSYFFDRVFERVDLKSSQKHPFQRFRLLWTLFLFNYYCLYSQRLQMLFGRLQGYAGKTDFQLCISGPLLALSWDTNQVCTGQSLLFNRVPQMPLAVGKQRPSSELLRKKQYTVCPAFLCPAL